MPPKNNSTDPGPSGNSTENSLDQDAASSEMGAAAEAGQPTVSQPQYIQELALILFDATSPLHELSEDSRRILAISALVYDQPYYPRKKDPLRAYWKAISNRLGDELPAVVEAQLLPILLLQCGRLRRKDILKLELSPAQQRSVLTLAAILRLAVGLDSSNSQTTQIQHIEPGRQVVWVAVGGPQAPRDAAAAQHNSRLWETIGYPKIKAAESSEVLGLFTPQFSVGEKAGIEPTDTIAEAGRKILRFHFAAMLANEEGTRAGDDIEHLHDMRVATRRMRAGFDVFGDAFERKTLNGYLKGLRAVGRALGRVRDLDVFMEKAQVYLDRLPEDQRSGLDPLLTEWHTQRQADRENMLAFLDGEQYQTFKARFGAFVMTPGAGVRPMQRDLLQPSLVCELAPVMIYQRFAEVRAYHDLIPTASIEQLHALRIEFKKIRYTVEYFREVLGPEAELLINEFKRIQDHLGDLNDAQIAIGLVQEFIQSHSSAQAEIGSTAETDLSGLATYQVYRETELARLYATFADVWDKFNEPELRRNLALAVSAL